MSSPLIPVNVHPCRILEDEEQIDLFLEHIDDSIPIQSCYESQAFEEHMIPITGDLPDENFLDHPAIHQHLPLNSYPTHSEVFPSKLLPESHHAPETPFVELNPINVSQFDFEIESSFQMINLSHLLSGEQVQPNLPVGRNPQEPSQPIPDLLVERNPQEPSPEVLNSSNERNPQEPSRRIFPHFKNPNGHKDIVFCFQEDGRQACTNSPDYLSNRQVTDDTYVDPKDLQMEDSLFKWIASTFKRSQHIKFSNRWRSPFSSNDSDKEPPQSANHAKPRRRNWDPGK